MHVTWTMDFLLLFFRLKAICSWADIKIRKDLQFEEFALIRSLRLINFWQITLEVPKLRYISSNLRICLSHISVFYLVKNISIDLQLPDYSKYLNNEHLIEKQHFTLNAVIEYTTSFKLDKNTFPQHLNKFVLNA